MSVNRAALKRMLRTIAVVLAVSAFPALAIGQETKAQPAPQRELKQREVKDLQNLIGELQIQLAPKASDGKSSRDLDAEIAELTRRLEALKAAKASADKGAKSEPAKPSPESKSRLIIVGPDGKVIESKDAPSKPHAIELKLGPDGKVIESRLLEPKADGQSFKVEIRQVDGKPHAIVIGADGKEIKRTMIEAQPKALPPVDSKLEEARKAMEKALENLRAQQQQFRLVRPALPAAPPVATKVINLTRATYALPKDKAEALAAFLKANAKASVLEVKVEADGLTVTTTPEVQSTVGGIVKLMTDTAPQGKPLHLELKLPQK